MDTLLIIVVTILAVVALRLAVAVLLAGGDLPRVGLTLLVGSYAQKYHLKERRKATLTETVRAFEGYLPDYFVLPHPSWRNKAWIKKNPWFAELVIPALRKRVNRLLRTV